MENKLVHHSKQVQIFENVSLQRKAREILPIDQLTLEAAERWTMLKEPKDIDLKDCLVWALLAWFKSYFSWFNVDYCDTCKQNMKFNGMEQALTSEQKYGQIRVEGYICEKCGGRSRFARYFHPEPLFTTRKGRCMEWASVFTLFCRSLGYEARYVYDETDHVWTEIFSVCQNRWIHADSCENKLDTPLMYELGWNKKLSYIFAFSNEEVVDVSWRYSNAHADLITRRNSCHEDWLARFTVQLCEHLQKNVPSARKMLLKHRRVSEIISYWLAATGSSDAEQEGRSSGSLAWRLSRNETEVSRQNSYSFSVTPAEVRQKRIEVNYCVTTNSYSRPFDPHFEGQKFENCSFKCINMFHKHEEDWKVSYLCRQENCRAGDNAEIEWKFEWAGKGLRFSSAFINFQHNTFENGIVNWKVITNKRTLNGTKDGTMQVEAAGDDSTSLIISATLSGGTGQHHWQQAQLFRSPDHNHNETPFKVQIKFQ